MNKGNNFAPIRIRIHAIKKCVNLSFARSITILRCKVLRDPLRDRDPLDRTLMTSLPRYSAQTLNVVIKLGLIRENIFKSLDVFLPLMTYLIMLNDYVFEQFH